MKYCCAFFYDFFEVFIKMDYTQQMNELKKFVKLRLEYKVLLAEAYVTLGLSRFALMTTEFKKTAKRLGNTMQKNSAPLNEKQRLTAKKIDWAVNVMSRYTFWESKCLVKAVAAKHMLNRRNLANTLYLGMAKDDQGNLQAHAWIECSDLSLTGSSTADRFTVVSSFSN